MQAPASYSSLARQMYVKRPPRVAIRTLQENNLMALDKCPEFQSIGIDEIWRHLPTKWFLKVASTEAKDAYGNAQLIAGLEAGIKGAVHTARTLFANKDNEEQWVFLLVDAANAFNAGSHITCLSTVQHC